MTGIATPLLDALKGLGDHPMLHGARATPWTAAEVARAAGEAAAGLLALGLTKGDRVLFVSDNAERWIQADLACLAAGLVDVPRAADASPDEVAFVARHSACRAVILQDAAQLARHAELLAAEDWRAVIVLDPGDAALPAGVLDFEALRARGQGGAARVTEALAAIGPADLATIVYTSGTTGNPKGVMLTHGNLLHNLRHLPGLFAFSRADRYLSFLPTWHTFERAVEYCALASGMSIHYSTKAALRKDLLRVRPTVVAGVPRLWESIAQGVQAKIVGLEGAKGALARGALACSERWGRADRLLRGTELDDRRRRSRPRGARRAALLVQRALNAPGQALADRLIFAKVRDVTGGAIRFLVSGGGALPRHVDAFFARSGLTLLNGYGLTETAPVVSVRLPDANVLETSGAPLPETAFRVTDESGERELPQGEKGVLWIRGPQVMRGYHANAEATARVMRDGWFCSGDLAYLSDRDDVVICGRAKDTLVLRGGENVEPELIENEILRSPLIEDVLLVGHGEKHLGALVLPAPDPVRARLGDLPEDRLAIARDPRVAALMQAEVAEAVSEERGFRIFERVPRLTLYARPFSAEDGTLTATMKKRRAAIEAFYADDLRRMFAEGSPAVQPARADEAPR